MIVRVQLLSSWNHPDTVGTWVRYQATVAFPANRSVHCEQLHCPEGGVSEEIEAYHMTFISYSSLTESLDAASFFAQSIVRNTSSHQQVSMLCIFLFVSSLQEPRGSVLITCTLPMYVYQQNLEGNAHSQNQASVANLVDDSCNCDQGISLWNELWEHLQYLQYWQASSNQLPQSNCEVNLMNLTGVIMDLTLNGSSIHRSWVFSLQLLSWKPPIRRNKLLHEIGVDFSFFTKISHWGSLLYQLLYLWSQWSLSNAMFCRARFRIGIQRLAMLVQLWWRAHCMATSMSKFRGTCLWW